MLKTGKRSQPSRNSSCIKPQAARQREAMGCILGIMRTAQGADAGQIERGNFFSIAPFPEHAADRAHAIFNFFAHRHPRHGEWTLERVRNSAARVIVHADDRQTALPKPGENTRLEGGVIVQRAVPVEMIGRDVDQRGGIRAQPRRQIDLVGGKFDHVDPGVRKRRQIEDRGADIAAKRCVETA